MRLSFRLKLYLASALVGVTAVGIASVLGTRALARETVSRIERGLVTDARLTAELLTTGGADPTLDVLDAQADRLGDLVGARVTLIAPDGTVLGDSAEDGDSLRALENHGTRPEVADAHRHGLGISRRYSTTVNTDMLYVAVRARHSTVAIVRLALPLTEIGAQVSVVRRAGAVALVIALAVALVLAWGLSLLLSARLQALAAAARQYADGIPREQAQPSAHDEVGLLERALNDSFATLSSRISELEQSRGRLRAILAGMVEGVVVVDGAGRMQLVNRSARQMLGMGPPDDGVKEGDSYLHAIRHPEVIAQFDAAMSGREPDAPEIVLPDGAVVVPRAVPLAHGGAVLVLHDITRLRQADQIRRDFVANVSHELRTPLTAIQGYAEALRDESLGAPERERFLDIIDRHTQRMTRLVQDLLRLARVEAGQEPAERTLCHVAELFETTVADLRPRADAKRQRIVWSVADGAERVRTDAAKIEEILKNLLENAINYSPESTEIRLHAARRDGHYEVRVLDEGPGIPASALRRIFERFYRVDTDRSRDTGGTGLGLAIVKHVAERLGGEVRAANRPGGGACFTLTLPDDEAGIAGR